jgi:GH35 family endo-1,4-beta-xylanase
MDYATQIKDNRFNDYIIPLGTEHSNQAAVINLEKHKFLFGCNAFSLLGGLSNNELDIYKKKFLDVFNAGTLPFYWGQYEPIEGKSREKEMLNAARWCKANNLTMKGHPLVWHTACADWLLSFDNKNIYKKQMERIERDITTFKGVIDTWDVINEVVILPVYDRCDNAISRLAKEYGAEEITVAFFKKAKECNPNSVLLINDFNHSKKYETLIERLLDRDCPIDVIGLQTHQHQGYHGTDYMADILERYSRFGLPLHFTEITILSGDLVPKHLDDLNDGAREDWLSTPEGEETQRQQVAEMYSQLYAHPSVQSVVWWDMQDGNWLNAPSGLLRRDLSPKPAYEELKKLTQQDWGFPSQEFMTDESGNVKIHGPEGTYKIKVSDREYSVVIGKDKTYVTCV